MVRRFTIKKVFKVISTLLIIAVVALLAIILIQRIKGEDPSLFGYQMNYIKTPSMEPVIKAGDVLLCKTVEVQQLSIGDIITYTNDGRMLNVPRGETICHEVVEEPYADENGIWYVQTKGLANTEKDPLIKGEQVIGRFVKKLPVMTAFYKVFLSKWGLFIVIIPLAALLVFEVIRITRKRGGTANTKGDASDNAT